MIADAHIDTMSFLLHNHLEFGVRNSQSHVDLPRLLEAGVRLQICALFTRPVANRSVQLQEILRQIAYARQQFALNEDRVVHAETADQVRNLAADKLTAVLSVEGGGALAGDLAMLDILFALGVRGLTLTWSNRNELGDGVGDPQAAGGLTGFGRQVVARMEELGMIVDVSHLSEAGFWDVMDTAQGPVVASHSNAKALCNHPRNLTDAQLQAIGERNGFIGINFLPAFLDDAGIASVDSIRRHAVHIAENAGVHCLGFGSDFDGISQLPEGIQDVLGFPQILEVLSKEFSSAEMELITHRNLQRVLTEILPD